MRATVYCVRELIFHLARRSREHVAQGGGFSHVGGGVAVDGAREGDRKKEPANLESRSSQRSEGGERNNYKHGSNY